MPKPKVLSGAEIVRILASFGRQTLTVPNHRELDRGTVVGIYRQALRYIPEEELAPQFFSN
jgi:hypothetical protein